MEIKTYKEISMQSEKFKLFTDKYDSIVIFGNYRTGSTTLCDILCNYIKDNGKKCFNWSEYLSSNQYVIKDKHDGLRTKSMCVDYINYQEGRVRLAERPAQEHIVESKLKFFREIKKNTFTIFKISPDDFKNENYKLIDEYIMKDDRIFKIGLNREDIANSIISLAIGANFNIWNSNFSEHIEAYKAEVTKVKVSLLFLDNCVRNIIAHNTWLYYNHNNLNQIVWFNELTHLNIPELGLLNFSKSKYDKIPFTHADRVNKYFLNKEEFLNFIEEAEREISPIVQNVHNVSTYKDSWEY